MTEIKTQLESTSCLTKQTGLCFEWPQSWRLQYDLALTFS